MKHKKRCAVCGGIAITKHSISINGGMKRIRPLCGIHNDAAKEDTKPPFKKVR